jgi:hypothetical protein
MAKALAQLPHVAVTILPFDVSRALRALEEGRAPQPD